MKPEIIYWRVLYYAKWSSFSKRSNYLMTHWLQLHEGIIGRDFFFLPFTAEPLAINTIRIKCHDVTSSNNLLRRTYETKRCSQLLDKLQTGGWGSEFCKQAIWRGGGRGNISCCVECWRFNRKTLSLTGWVVTESRIDQFDHPRTLIQSHTYLSCHPVLPAHWPNLKGELTNSHQQMHQNKLCH
jgi:hypothetical protein